MSRDLGLNLVAPDGRGIRLTPDGEQLAKSAQQAMGIISATLTEIRQGDTGQPIVLSCERSVAMRWLIPRLSQFQDAHPDIPVHLSVGGGHLDFERDGIALAIRRMDFTIEPSWSVRTIFEEAMGPVMPEGLVANFERGQYIGLGAKTRPDAWSTWLARNPDVMGPTKVRYFDHHFLMAEAAASGMGIGMCPRVIVADDIESGRLKAPSGFSPDGSSYGLIHLNTAALQPHINELHTWIRVTSTSLTSPD